MSVNRDTSYGQLLRGSGDRTLPDGSLSGSNHHSQSSLHPPSPMRVRVPAIKAEVSELIATPAEDNRDIAVDLTNDKMGLTFFTAGAAAYCSSSLFSSPSSGCFSGAMSGSK